MHKIGVIGTGFIAKGFINSLLGRSDYSLSKILTRSEIKLRDDLNDYVDYLTNDIDLLIESSDLIVECSGDTIYACDTINEIIKTPIPIITMNTEFHVTVGSYFIDKGLITEAAGDQPGVLAALREEAIEMGFEPIAYSNIKGFLNKNPSKEDMLFWSNKSKISLDMVTSFTDGTKVQLEQALVANAFGATIIQNELVGIENDNMQSAGEIFGKKAEELGTTISDYILSSKLRPGVFIVAKHNSNQKDSLSYYKMGDGPYYILDKPFHLCHLEIYKTMRRVLTTKQVLLDNSKSPTISVASIAKRDLKVGEKIKKGIGSFEIRGIAVKIKENPNHVPVGLMANITIKRDIKEGQIITFDDIDIPETLALKAWKDIEKKVLSKS